MIEYLSLEASEPDGITSERFPGPSIIGVAMITVILAGYLPR
jgi:hypothetical protein